jgi:hypothetical protein
MEDNDLDEKKIVSELTKTCVDAINVVSEFVGSNIHLDPNETDLDKIADATKSLKKDIKKWRSND